MNRRELITGLISFVAAPAIVRVTSIMPVKNMFIGREPMIIFDPEVWAEMVAKTYSDLLLYGRADIHIPSIYKTNTAPQKGVL